MRKVLCMTLRFLDAVPQFHGKGDDGDPEWPPSPLRFFQALVAAATHHLQEADFNEKAFPALRWLESVLPNVVAPATESKSFGYRMYVPNNSGDLMTAAWSRGDTETSMAKFRVEKDVRPINLTGDAVHFVYPLPTGECPHFDVLKSAMRAVTHLGWGINMVAGNAEILNESDMASLNCEFWQPVTDGDGSRLRVPIAGTLGALIAKHNSFLERIGPLGFKPVPPLAAFRVVGYRRATEPAPRQFAAFSILKPDASGVRSFDSVRRTRDVAGMIRNAAATTARQQGWSVETINEFIHGKTPDGSRPPDGPASPDRFQYLPLPTINSKMNRVESVRRVLIVAPPHCGNQILWARRALAGAELFGHDGIAGMLSILPGSDWVLKQYTGESNIWTTVTPVILPGYDDPDHLRRKLKDGRDAETQKRYLARLEARMVDLLRKSFRQAGYASEFVNEIQFEWGEVGFRRGIDLASNYLPPENLSHSPRYHVKVTFPSSIRGPIAVGSGRFRGFGLFATMED